MGFHFGLLSGKTHVNGIECATLNLIATTGEISVTGSRAVQFTASQTSGRLQILDSQISNGQIKHTSGDLDIQNTRLQGMRIASTSGRVVFDGLPPATWRSSPPPAASRWISMLKRMPLIFSSK